MPRLKRLRDQGRLQEFRAEAEKLLHGPAEEFFPIMGAFIESPQALPPSGGGRPAGSRELKAGPPAAKAFLLEKKALAYVLTPALGKKDRYGRTARQEAAKGSGNYAVYDFLSRYDDRFDHEIYRSGIYKGGAYKGKGESVWDQELKMYPKGVLWRGIPEIQLEGHAAAQALLRGDSKGFRQALDDLRSGPAWETLALIHSRMERTGQTLFHLAAVFEPSQSHSISQKYESIEAAKALERLIEFVQPPAMLESMRKNQEGALGAKLWSGALALGGAALSAAAFYAGEPALGAALALPAACGAYKCRKAFAKKNQSKTSCAE